MKKIKIFLFSFLLLSAVFAGVSLVKANSPTLTTPASCIIQDNLGACNMNIHWDLDNGGGASSEYYIKYNKGNLVGNPGSLLFRDYVTREVIPTTMPGTVEFSLVHEIYGSNNPVIVATSSTYMSCNDGAEWNGSKCIPATGTISYSNCSVPEGSTSCNADISWSIGNRASGSTSQGAITTPNLNDNSTTTVVTGNSGTVSYPVEKNTSTTRSGQVFYLYYLSKLFGFINISPAFGNIDTASCIIPSMKSTCTPALTWSTKDTFATPAITATISGSNTTLSTGTSGSLTDSSHALNYGENRSYFLYHDGTQFDSVNIIPVCAANTWWNGSMCSPGDLLISNSCEIPIGGSSCNIAYKFKWTTGTTPNPEVYSSSDVQFSISAKNSSAVILSGEGDSLNLPNVLHSITGWSNIQSGISQFYNTTNYNLTGLRTEKVEVYYDTKLIDSHTVSSYCKLGSGWNGTICSPATFNVSPSSCIVPTGSSTCAVNLDFSIIVNPLMNGNTNDVTTIKTSTGVNVPWGSGGYNNEADYKCPWNWIFGADCITKQTSTRYGKVPNYAIKPGDTTFNLYNNFGTSYYPEYTARGTYLMGTKTATARCVYGYTFDGTKCSLPEGTFVVTPCEIDAGRDSCDATLTWDVRNPAGSNKTNITFTTEYHTNATAVTNGASSGSKNFVLFKDVDRPTVVVLKHDGVQLASYTGSASCKSGTMWNGSTCALTTIPLSGNIYTSDCNISSGGEGCAFPVFWSSYQYIVDDNGNRTGQVINPVNPSYIEVYHNGNYSGKLNIDSVSAGGPTVGDDGEAYPYNGSILTWNFDSITDEFYDGSWNKVPYYGLPDRSANHYRYVNFTPEQRQEYGITDDNIVNRSVTFKLFGSYTDYSTASGDSYLYTNGRYSYKQYTHDALRNLCVKEGGDDCLNLPSTVISGVNVHYYTRSILLDSKTVNATCSADHEWDSTVNKCLPVCVTNYQRSGTPYQCRPIKNQTVGVILTEADGTLIPTTKDPVTGETMATEKLPTNTEVKVGFTAVGFYNNNITCRLLVNGLQEGDPWTTGKYEAISDETVKKYTVTTNPTKFSVQCYDGIN